MKVDILASGSSGNCIALTSGETTILIDAGIARTKIEKALMEVGIKAADVKAIFVTHAHGDHVRGLPLANKYKIPVYAGAGEWKVIKGVDDELRKTAKAGFADGIDFKLEVLAFKTHHDSHEPIGYVVKNIETGFQCSICLDTGIVDAAMLNAMKDSDVYIIESNHEPRMVEASAYPTSVKVRILSHVGHLSNEQTADTLSRLVRGNGELIYLTHLSNKNNLPMLAEMTTVKKLLSKGFVRNKHYKIEVK